MSKDPAILFYTSDFLTGTMTMSNEQVGKYIRLLCLQHQKRRLSSKDMLSVCITHDEDIFSKFTSDESGYFNERLEIEINRRVNYSKSRSSNRSKKKETYVNHMETVNETVTINKNEIEKVGAGGKNTNDLNDLSANLDELYSNQMWVDVVMKNNQIDKPVFDYVFKEFRTKCLTACDDHSMTGLKKYFSSWFPFHKKRLLTESNSSKPNVSY